MAAMRTHAVVSVISTGLLTMGALAADAVAPENLLTVFFCGAVGGLLPDIDRPHSPISSFLYEVVALSAAYVAAFGMAGTTSLSVMAVLWVTIYAVVRVMLRPLIVRFLSPRGATHSILALAVTSLASAAAIYHVLRRPDGVAWLAAGAVAFGYSSHLFLDTLFVIDADGRPVTEDLEWPLKLFSRRDGWANVAMLLAAAGVALAVPPTNTFARAVADPSIWQGLWQRL